MRGRWAAPSRVYNNDNTTDGNTAVGGWVGGGGGGGGGGCGGGAVGGAQTAHMGRATTYRVLVYINVPLSAWEPFTTKSSNCSQHMHMCAAMHLTAESWP